MHGGRSLAPRNVTDPSNNCTSVSSCIPPFPSLRHQLLTFPRLHWTWPQVSYIQSAIFIFPRWSSSWRGLFLTTQLFWTRAQLWPLRVRAWQSLVFFLVRRSRFHRKVTFPGWLFWFPWSVLTAVRSTSFFPPFCAYSHSQPSSCSSSGSFLVKILISKKCSFLQVNEVLFKYWRWSLRTSWLGFGQTERQSLFISSFPEEQLQAFLLIRGPFPFSWWLLQDPWLFCPWTWCTL
jgi:hypothetical protein